MDKICVEYLDEQWHHLIPLQNPHSKHYFNHLLSAYSESHRFYHTPEHLCHLIGLLREASVTDAAVYWAAFYHDYVYVAGRKDNEIKSADIAKVQLADLGIDLNIINRCHQLILLTQHHQLTGNDSEAAAFLDADMSILGSTEAVYADYLDKIRKEYSSIPTFLYKRGRKKFIKSCLAQKRLYQSEWFFMKYEAQAKINLNWELVND